MTDVELLLARYKEAHRSDPGADPTPFLDQVSGLDREQLAALLDAYLERAPRRALDASELRESPAAAVADGLQRSLTGASGIWPAVLPRLRAQARLRRSELVAELAARLGAQSQQEKVASYYHEMEQGRLEASGVSDTVLEALGRIVGWSREALRQAGELPAPGGPGGDAPTAPAFARTTRPATDPAAEPPARGPAASDAWDEVDRLFRGGR